MDNRDCTIRELKEFFSIDDAEINDFLDHKINEGTLSRCNNFPSDKIFLMEDYIKGATPFFERLSEFHQTILSKLNQAIQIPESVKNSTDTDIALQLFSEHCDTEYYAESSRRSLERIYNEIIDNKAHYDSAYFRGAVNLYYEIHFDIQSCFGNCGRRSQQSADLDIFRLSKELMRHTFFWNMPVIPSSIILIRQSIETKILQTFGIQEVQKQDGTKAIIGINKILKFCKLKAQAGIMDFPVDIDLIIKINTWCNLYVHTGNFSMSTWTVEWLQHSLSPLFSGGSDRNWMSLDRSITIDDAYLHQSLFPDLESHLSSRRNPITVVHGDHKFLIKNDINA